MIKKLLGFLLVLGLYTGVAHADAWTDCGAKIIANGGFATKVSEIIKSKPGVSPGETLQSRADDLRLLLLAYMFDNETGLCKPEITEIAKFDELKLSFELNGTKYRFDINVDNLFDHFETQTAIMVYNNRNKRTWDVIKSSDIPKLYWSNKCSNHTIWYNLDDDASVNVAGQNIFTEYGGTDDEFFLDFEKGNDMRAFPGIVLQDVTASTAENIVVFTHLPTAIKKAKAFADKLQNSHCSNQGLSVYLVSLAGTHSQTGVKGNETAAKWIAGTGVGIGTIMVGGVAVAAKGILGAVVGSSLIAAGASVSWVPVAGWIIGGAALVAGGIISLVPTKIADIESVYVLDGPHIIR